MLQQNRTVLGFTRTGKMWSVEVVLLLVSLYLSTGACGRLSVSGSHFMKDGQRVFLSGANQAWVNYAYDFGHNHYQNTRRTFVQTLNDVKASGGNSIRVWVHIEGESTPTFDHNGYVTGVDSTLISDLRSYLHDARIHGILVFFTLWNGAVNQQYHYRLNGLIVDTRKLQSYIDNALVHMVNALKNEPALGGWDLMNEPEGELKPGEYNSDGCFDTRALEHSGAGWAGKLYTAQQFQRFFNWQADAIRRADPHAQVTVGSWNAKANSDHGNYVNLWKDSCLVKAGGRQYGKLTFYQVHTYDSSGHWDDMSPFRHSYSYYGLGKPLVIGEFNGDHSAGMSTQSMFQYAYSHGYAGAWTWSHTDTSWTHQKQGMQAIRNNNDQHSGGLVHFSV